MKVKYFAIPLTALGLVAVEHELPSIRDKVYEALSGKETAKTELVAQNPSRNELEKLIGGVAYAQEPVKEKTYNPRDEFKKLGWEVYDVKTDDLGKITPPERLQFRITKEEFRNAYRSNLNDIKNYFSLEEQQILELLMNVSYQNGELRFVFITPGNRISITLLSPDKDVGKNGLYVVRKGLNPSQAEDIRKISPDYRKH